MGVVYVSVRIQGRIESHPNQVAEDYIDAKTVGQVDDRQVPEEWLKEALIGLIEVL